MQGRRFPTSLIPQSLASLEGFEPPTDRVEAGCSESTELQRDKFGAGDRVRTDDIFLGKEVLYQLSYTRMVPDSHRLPL